MTSHFMDHLVKPTDRMLQNDRINNGRKLWCLIFLTYLLVAYIGSITALKAFDVFGAMFGMEFYTMANPTQKSYLLFDFLRWLLGWPLIILFITSPLIVEGRPRRLLTFIQVMILLFVFSVGIKNAFKIDELAPLGYFAYFSEAFGIYIGLLICGLFLQNKAVFLVARPRPLTMILSSICMMLIGVVGATFYLANTLPDITYKKDSSGETQRVFETDLTVSQIHSCRLLLTLSSITQVMEGFAIQHCPAVSKDHSLFRRFPFPYIADNDLQDAYAACRVKDVYMPGQDVAGICIDGSGGFITLNKDMAKNIIVNNSNKCGVNRTHYVGEKEMLKSMKQECD